MSGPAILLLGICGVLMQLPFLFQLLLQARQYAASPSPQTTPPSARQTPTWTGRGRGLHGLAIAGALLALVAAWMRADLTLGIGQMLLLCLHVFSPSRRAIRG